MKKIFFAAVLISFLFAGPLSGFSAMARDNALPDPGLTPDSSFYFLKTWKEQIQTFFTFGAENKAKQFLHLAEVRLAEYQKMLEKGKTEIAQKTFEKYERQLKSAIEKTNEMRSEGKDMGKISEEIEQRRTKQQEAVRNVTEKLPDETKQEIFTERQQKWMDFIKAVQKQYPQIIPGNVEGSALSVSLIINCPIPEIPLPSECKEEWGIKDIGGCPQFACPEDSKKLVLEPPGPRTEDAGGSAAAPAESSAQSAEAVAKSATKHGEAGVSITPPASSDLSKPSAPSISPIPPTPSSPPKPPISSEPTEIRYYTCPDGVKVESGKCYGKGETLRCALKVSPELQCAAPTPPVTKGGVCATSGEIKYYDCPVGAQVAWCMCGPESGQAGAKNAWQCQHLPQLSCPKSPPAPKTGPEKTPSGKCTAGEKINYNCADGTSFKWCTCDDLGWDCPMYKYANRLCPATKEITLETGQHMPDTCAPGEALNTRCSDGRTFRSCICDKNMWECGLEPICPQPGPPAVGSVSLSGAVTSDLSVELQATPFGTVRIVWMASEPVTSRVEYGLTTSYGSTAGPDYFGSTYQGVDLSGLQSNIAYHFRIRIRDKDISPNTAVTEDYTFTIRKLPELLIQPISVDHFNANTPNKIHVKILNNGVAAAFKGFVVKIYIDGVLAREGTYDSDIAAGAFGEKIFDYTFSGAKSYAEIKAVVDATNLVAELNEKNNETQYSMSIYGSSSDNPQKKP